MTATSVVACLAVVAVLIVGSVWLSADSRPVERSIAESGPVEEPSTTVQDEGPNAATPPPATTTPPTTATLSTTPIATHPPSTAPLATAPIPVAPIPVAPSPAGPSPAEPTFEPTPKPTLVEQVQAMEDEAVSVTMHLIEEFPDSIEPLGLLGKVHRHYLNHAKAIQCWEQCVARNPKRTDAYVAIALTAYRMGDCEKAVAAGRKAVVSSPKMPGVRVHLGKTLLAIGKPQEAVILLQQETQLAPDSAEAHFLLGQAHRQLENDEQALSCYEKAIELRSDYTDAYYALAALCARRGMPQQAAEYRARFKELKEATRRSEVFLDSLEKATLKLAMTYYDVGRLYEARGKLQQAEQRWLKAVAVNPKSIRSRKALIELYQKENRPAEALAISDQLRDALPEYAEAHALFSLLSARSARFDAAESAIRRAIELDPNNANYRRLDEKLRQRK